MDHDQHQPMAQQQPIAQQQPTAAQQMMPQKTGRPTGVVKFFDSKKGFGFITPDDQSEDIFVHFSAIKGDGYRSLQAEQKVQYEVSFDQNKQKNRAIEVTDENGNVLPESAPPAYDDFRRGGGFGGGGGFSRGHGGGGGYGGGGGHGRRNHGGGWNGGGYGGAGYGGGGYGRGGYPPY